MKYILTLIALTVASTAWASENNQAMKACLDQYGYDRTAPIEERMAFDFKGPAKCHAEYRNAVLLAEREELRDFLKHNPRYRVPGQSLNRCWGKPREMPFESAYIEKNGDGFTAGVSYKDTMPAGCYENGPWDNRYGN